LASSASRRTWPGKDPNPLISIDKRRPREVRDSNIINPRRLGAVRGNISLHRHRVIRDNITISLHRSTMAHSNISIEELVDVVPVTRELVLQGGCPGISISHWLRHALFRAII
jgi:hypothetical protein